MLTPEYLKSTIKDLEALKNKISGLRQNVSDKFAEHIGRDPKECCIQ